MVGKTFKGMTDEMLAWQTDRFQELKTHETGHTVWVRPEQVVEVALDGAQASTRYPGGVALRFARVRRYRDDKGSADADTLDAVRRLLPGGARGLIATGSAGSDTMSDMALTETSTDASQSSRRSATDPSTPTTTTTRPSTPSPATSTPATPSGCSSGPPSTVAATRCSAAGCSEA